jgi:hypothetical protein
MRNTRYTPDQLARAYFALHRLSGRGNRREIPPGTVPNVYHPAVLIQAAFQETFRPASPIEVYSEDQPVIPRSAAEEGWIPIDVLLGCYRPRNRTILIFRRNIERFANNPLHCDVSDLEAIVRLHEYAHALVHLGVFWPEESEVIRDYLRGKETDWNAFLRNRSKAFRSLDSAAHEFLAQTLSWVAIGVLQPIYKRNILQELFVTLMGRQPPEYRLSPDILGKSCYADPTALLSWVRETPRYQPTRRQPKRQIAEALLRVTFP